MRWAQPVRASLEELRQSAVADRLDIADVFLVPGELPRCRLIRDTFGMRERS